MTQGCHLTEKGYWSKLFMMIWSQQERPPEEAHPSPSQFLPAEPRWWSERRKGVKISLESDFSPCSVSALHWWIGILSLVPGLQYNWLPVWAFNCSSGRIAPHCWRLSNIGLFRARSFLQLFRPQCWSSSGQPSNQCTFSIKHASRCVSSFSSHTIHTCIYLNTNTNSNHFCFGHG